MTLNANKLKAPNNPNKKYPPALEAGTYPARLVQVLLLGIQKERPFKGEEKAPRLHIYLTYELLDEFMKDDDGLDMEDKPRWISEEIPFMSLKADLAKSTKRYFALDPEQKYDGDWAQLVGTPCMITLVREEDKRPDVDRVYNKVASVSSMRPKEAAKAAKLKNEPKVFDFYDPDMDIFDLLPDWLQDKMKDAVDFDGSALQKALKGHKPKEKEVKQEAEQPVEDKVDEDGEDW